MCLINKLIFILTPGNKRRSTGYDGIVVNIDSKDALYMIKHIIMNKLIWGVNHISSCGQAMPQYVWLLKSPTFLLPNIYYGFSS